MEVCLLRTKFKQSLSSKKLFNSEQYFYLSVNQISKVENFVYNNELHQYDITDI